MRRDSDEQFYVLCYAEQGDSDYSSLGFRSYPPWPVPYSCPLKARCAGARTVVHTQPIRR